MKRWLDYVYLPLRIKHKVVAEVLLPAKIKALPGYAPSDKKDPVSKLTKLQFVENPIFDTTNEIVLYGGNKIAIVMFEESEMMGLVIKSKTLYATLSALFDLTRERETNA
ncbi:MAG: hypothetical protein LBU27_01860 [Candidatus Peribacteria bacterium]|nr:hypothetical protein [Candidatus Peribacteria bacterium]